MSEERTYTKSDIMQALSFMKTPTEEEISAIKEMNHEGEHLNDTEPIQFMLEGAEVMAEVLLEGLSAEEARDKTTVSAGKLLLKGICKRALEEL